MTAFMTRLALMAVLGLFALFFAAQSFLSLVHFHFMLSLIWGGVSGAFGIGSVRQALKP